MEWAERDLQVGDGRRAVVREGGPTGAPPLLVLHDAGADTVDAPAWVDLAGDHHVVQLLLPGYGGSTPPPPGVAVPWVVAHLQAVLDALGWDVPHVIGTSLGGWFATELALAAPDRVRRLTLCDPAGLQHPQAYLLALFADGRAAAGTEAMVEQTLHAHLPPGRRPDAETPPALARAVLAPYIADMAAAALSSWNPWVPDPGMQVRLRELAVPTAVLWGERDALIPVAHGRAMAEAAPAIRLEVVTGAGHLLPLEQPDRVAAAVRADVRP